MSEGPRPVKWCPEEAEDLLRTLPGILSSRVVTDDNGAIVEIHILSTDELAPKQTVRNVESAVAAHFQVDVDHRKISVARVIDGPTPPKPAPESVVSLVMDDEEDEVPAKPETGASTASEAPAPGAGNAEGRIVYESHRSETEHANRVRVTVVLSFAGEVHEGSAISANLPRSRMEAAANATLRAVEAVAAAQREEAGGSSPMVALALDGVKVVTAFDRDFALAAVHALAGRDIVALAGASVVHDRADAAVIMSVLQATDRWVRGRII